MGLFSAIVDRYRSARRYNQIIRVFIKYGFENMVSYMVETKRFGFIRNLIPRSTRLHASKYSKWEKMRLVCEELGPTFVKFGQILSNRPDLLPKELIEQFEQLQDHVPPVPGDIILKVVETELKGSVDDIFAWFEPEAFASASMAQVHKATLKTGEKIALKIQRPGIREIIIEDIKVMYTLAEIIENRIPSMKTFDPSGLVRNFEESILKELDFILESVNVQRFYNNILTDTGDKRNTYAPKVFQEYTTGKILALEFMSGIKISNLELIENDMHDPKQIAYKLSISFLKQIFVYGFFHADPHPGNILILPNGDICYLDFGMMGSIMERDIEAFGNLFIAIKNKNIHKIIRSLQQLSGSSNIKDLRTLEFSVNEFVQNYSVNSIHTNEMSTVLLQVTDIIVDNGLKVPPHFFLLARSMVTIEGLIHHLNPELDLLELARPFLIETLQKKYNPMLIAKKFLNSVYEMGSYMEEFPRDLKNAIRKINTGQIKVDITHKGIDPMVHTIHRITKQIVTALIISALLVSSAVFIIFEVDPLWKGKSAFGIIGLIIATILGYKMVKDFRKGDHDDWKGWKDWDK